MNRYNQPAKILVTRCQALFALVKSYIAQSPWLSRFIEGPSRLITARFNRRHAVSMVALSIPALLVTALLTLPGFLFNTPQHNEYFEFAKQLNQGEGRWVAMGLSACCSFFCFAIPCEEYPTEESAEDQ